MKRFGFAILALCLLVSLTGCGPDDCDSFPQSVQNQIYFCKAPVLPSPPPAPPVEEDNNPGGNQDFAKR